MKDKRIFWAVVVPTCILLALIGMRGLMGKREALVNSSRADIPSEAAVRLEKAPSDNAKSTVEIVPTGREQKQGGIDHGRLARAEADYALNQLYEAEARATLPTLSVQTHNPVWALENDSRQGASPGSKTNNPSSSRATTPSPEGERADQASGPLPAPQSGPFGNIQPADGEIWLRIPADQARQYRDIMAQHADLYKASTGKTDPVTVSLWVGGRLYERRQYE